MKLLIATDFSENANRAVEFAVNAFGPSNEKLDITLVHAIKSKQAGAVMTVSMSEELEQNAQKTMEVIQKDIEQRFEGLQVSTEIKVGSLPAVLTVFAEQIQPDYVIMGTNGITGLYEKVIGSNTREVMNIIEYPLIAVPHNCVLGQIETTLMTLEAVDADEEKVVQVIDLCKKLDCDLHLVHFMDQNEKAEPFTFNTGMFAGLNYSMDQIRTISGEVEDHILKFAKRDAVGLIAIIPHHKTFFKGLFHHSVTENLLRVSDVPVLVI